MSVGAPFVYERRASALPHIKASIRTPSESEYRPRPEAAVRDDGSLTFVETGELYDWTADVEAVGRELMRAVAARFKQPAALGSPLASAELKRLVGQTITDRGLGVQRAFDVFSRVLAEARIAIDDPRFLALIPSAPTPASVIFELAVSGSGIYGGTWLEGAGAVFAENEALRWLAKLAGLPATAGGCFATGGTHGNLSALLSARNAWADARPNRRPDRWQIAVSTAVHSSVRAVARAMDAEVIDVPCDATDRMSGETLHATLNERAGDGLIAVVATAGTTNLGQIDDLAGIAEVCERRGLWLHVDAAYGGAALAAPSVRSLFSGIERADSLIIDPHKWLFAPFDSCALLYRDPSIAQQAHGQRAAYLDGSVDEAEWNPSDYALHLSRRARGLPFWFSLAAHGEHAYSAAIEHTLEIARGVADEATRRPNIELVQQPTLSIVAFERHGWTHDDYAMFCRHLLEEGSAFLLPTIHRSRPLLRVAIVNPRTSVQSIANILERLELAVPRDLRSSRP
jgi:L-2,4-diaminobutyrate decarboxylase